MTRDCDPPGTGGLSCHASGRTDLPARPPAGLSVGRRSPPPLAVKLPDRPTVPAPWRGATYVLRRLLTAGDDNPKLRKSNAAGTPYRSWGLALAPARESGYSVCPESTPGCRAACLYRQGHARLAPAIQVCRLARTAAWKAHPDWFAAQLIHELSGLVRRAAAGDYRVAVRLNLTSDVAWERELPGVFDRFAEVQFYDYTKRFGRAVRHARGQLPPNYHLTFSRSETNEGRARAVLAAGGSVAVVFRAQPFPARYLGRPVVDGEVTDLRFLGPPGVVVALAAKGTARADATGFVVDAGRPGRSLPVLG
ncbi:MAG TPA: hypothetical protein VH092_24890 [Urbifossiella sp.]|jgi:hypothetical protein|nr:hypothetical protein [Urbifossiella sp.]